MIIFIAAYAVKTLLHLQLTRLLQLHVMSILLQLSVTAVAVNNDAKEMLQF